MSSPTLPSLPSEPSEELLAEANMSQADLHEEIAALAHQRWEEEGQPDGRDLDFWLSAEREVLSRNA